MAEERVMWAVASGEDSDYSVLCVCDTLARAERIVEILRGDEEGYHRDPHVQELLYVDAEPEKVTIYQYSVELWDDGTSGEVDSHVTNEWPFTTWWTLVPVSWRWVRAPIYGGKGGRLEVRGTDHKRVKRVLAEKTRKVKTDPVFRKRREAAS